MRFTIRPSAVVVTLLTLGLPAAAFAQGQIDVGRANDANNRIGGDGRNGGYQGSNYNSNVVINGGNRIVTGNVSQGREFHGTVPYSDPSAFRGTASSGIISDTFAKNSVGAPRPNAPEPLPNSSVPFYGVSQTAVAPQGFQLNASRTGFVAAPANTGARPIQDNRIGVIDLNQPINSTPLPGEMITRGSLNPQSAQAAGILTGSALYGVREWNPQDPADRAFLENLINRQNGSNLNRLQLDPRDVQKMRAEIEKALAPNDQRLNNEVNNGAANQQKQNDSLTLNPLGRTLETPANPALNNKPINDQLQSQPQGADQNTELGMRNTVLGIAHRSSSQYGELNKRLEQFYADRRNSAQASAQQFNADMKRREATDAAAAAKKRAEEAANSLTNPKNPVANNTKPGDADADKTQTKKPAPLRIKSFSQGVAGEGLGNLMKKAEGLMKDGKYTSALDQYDAAEAVMPNNPLIWMGRANAELGAGFFKRADAHLRQAFSTDQALLMGQYDISGMLGEERLGKLVEELKTTATKNPNDPMPVFLLSYIAYNTGHERQALGYLDLAEKRAGNQDPFFKMLHDHWTLPEEATKPKTQLNK